MGARTKQQGSTRKKLRAEICRFKEGRKKGIGEGRRRSEAKVDRGATEERARPRQRHSHSERRRDFATGAPSGRTPRQRRVPLGDRKESRGADYTNEVYSLSQSEKYSKQLKDINEQFDAVLGTSDLLDKAPAGRFTEADTLEKLAGNMRNDRRAKAVFEKRREKHEEDSGIRGLNYSEHFFSEEAVIDSDEQSSEREPKSESEAESEAEPGNSGEEEPIKQEGKACKSSVTGKPADLVGERSGDEMSHDDEASGSFVGARTDKGHSPRLESAEKPGKGGPDVSLTRNLKSKSAEQALDGPYGTPNATDEESSSYAENVAIPADSEPLRLSEKSKTIPLNGARVPKLRKGQGTRAKEFGTVLRMLSELGSSAEWANMLPQIATMASNHPETLVGHVLSSVDEELAPELCLLTFYRFRTNPALRDLLLRIELNLAMQLTDSSAEDRDQMLRCLYIGEVLTIISQGRIAKGIDVAVVSRRVVPETLRLVEDVLTAIVSPGSVERFKEVDLLSESTAHPTKADVLNAAVGLLSKLIPVYSGLPCFPEAFRKICALDLLASEDMAENSQETIRSLHRKQKLAIASRKPMTLFQARLKPQPIRQVEPSLAEALPKKTGQRRRDSNDQVLNKRAKGREVKNLRRLNIEQSRTKIEKQKADDERYRAKLKRSYQLMDPNYMGDDEVTRKARAKKHRIMNPRLK